MAPDQENEGGDSRSEDGSLPWSHSFDVTVTRARPFNVQLGAVCSSASEQDVTATVLVDGVAVDEETRTGQNVNAQAGTTLTLDG